MSAKKNKQKKSMSGSSVIILTGMHRSGTSLMASVLQAAGIHIGENLLNADGVNIKGYFEDVDFLEFQRSLLRECARSEESGWHDWGWTESEVLEREKLPNYLPKAQRLIRDRAQKYPLWGWKDPRTSLILDFWHELLPEAKYLLVYRFPWDVADSIVRLNSPIFSQHPDYPLKIWKFYNRHLLDFYQRHPKNCILFNVNSFLQNPQTLVNRLQNKLGLSVTDFSREQFKKIYEPNLLRSLTWSDRAVQTLQQSDIQSLDLLAELDAVADIPSQFSSTRQAIAVSQTQPNQPVPEEPTVSVVIPCYNQGEFLLDAVSSVEQCRGVKYEIIIVNDGSTERRTLEALFALQKRGYFVINQSNQGLARARNIGITAAKGRYILPLDADNKVRPNYPRKGSEILDKFPEVGVVYGSAEYFGEKSGLWEVEDFNPQQLLRGNYIDACAVIRKSLWVSCGGYDANMPIQGYEDWDLWLSAVEQGWKFHRIPEVMFDYRVRSGSMISLCSIPENRQQLIRYVCSKHRSLYIPHLAEILAEKEFIALREQQRSESLEAQLQSIQQQLERSRSQMQQLLAGIEELQAQVRSPLAPAPAKNLPLVSICIPTYNGEKYIAAALESALAQTYSCLEILVSDDNSTDKTVAIAQLFQQKSPHRFSILPHEQYGLVQNWNFCVSQAKGKYVKFLFQDDLLEPTCIEEMVNLAERDEAIGLVFSPRGFLRSEGAERNAVLTALYQGCRDSHKIWSNLQPIQWGRELLDDPHLLDNPLNKIGEPSTVLIKKAVFAEIGLFDTELHQIVDLDMWLRIMGHYKIGFVDKTLSHFRLHLQQQTLKNTLSGVSDTVKFYGKLACHPSYSFLPPNLRHIALCLQAVWHERREPLRDFKDTEVIDKLRQSRREIAEQWRQLPAEKIQSACGGTLGKAHKLLLNSSLKFVSLTDAEQAIAHQLTAEIAKGLDTPHAVANLLAASLYCRPEQLPIPETFTAIPAWFIQDYLEFMLRAPSYFHELGEVESYAAYLQKFVTALHRVFLANPDSTDWKPLASAFTRVANFSPLYCSVANLQDIYTKRSQILEIVVSANGNQLDWTFPQRQTPGKIRLGILAEHFAPSPTTFLSLPTFEHLNQNDFEVILYCLSNNGTPLERYCQSRASSCKLLSPVLSEQVASIRADNLDLLLIASNATGAIDPISLLSLHRLARVQIASAASPVTTGIRHVDFYLAGSLTEPLDDAQQHYREQLVKLDGSGYCFSYGGDTDKGKLKINRERLGLSNEAVVFISGAEFFKVIPELSQAWAKILAAVPNSVLILYPFVYCRSKSDWQNSFYRSLGKILARQGVSEKKLLLLNFDLALSRADIQECLKLGDVYLDSYPHAGAIALVEALAVGLPAVARQGTSSRACSGAALLQELGLPDLVAASESAYVELAVSLGNNRKMQQQKRRQVQQKMRNRPQFLDSKNWGDKIGGLFQNLLADRL